MSNSDIALIVEKIKSMIRIEELITEDGIELKQHGRGFVGYHSNKHDSDSKTSLSVDPVQGLYNCFNCGEGGDVFTWLMKNRNMSFMDALYYLAQRAGIELPEIDPDEQKRQNERRHELQQLWDLYTTAAEIYHGMLGEQGYKLLLGKWGLTAETAKKVKFGFAPAGGKFISKKLQERGFDDALINRSGLINKGGYDHFQGRLIFPYWKDGKVVYFIARQIEKTPDTEHEQDKFKKLLVHSENPYVSEAVNNENFVGEDTARGTDELVITEGIADCYAAIQAGFACISPATVTFRKADLPRLAMLAKKAKAVYICNDNDENKAGEKGALVTAEYLESQGVNARLIWLPRPEGVDKIDLAKSEGVDKVDLADYLREHTAEDFRELKRQAKTLLELAIEELSRNPEDAERRGEVILRISKLESEIEKKKKINEIALILGIGKTIVTKEVDRIGKKELSTQATQDEEKETQADKLIRLAQSATLIKDEHNVPYALIPIGGHVETRRIKGTDFRFWLTCLYLDETEKAPNSEAIAAAINAISAKAWKDGKQYTLNVRTAWHDGMICYDMGNPAWQTVIISPDNWSITNKTDIPLFRRFSHMQAQPDPDPAGDVKRIFDFVNIKENQHRILYIVTLITSFIPDIPHVVLVIFGPGGAGKSTFSKMTRMIVDPSSALTCRSYRDKKEFLQYLAHNHICILDNLSGISPELSDLICSAVTGDGESRRMLYTDDDDLIFNFKRSFIINGINNVAFRPDLLRRSILFPLEQPEIKNMQEETKLWKEFEQARPGILGGIFNTLAKAMRIYQNTKLTGLYDMADFTKWGAAVSEALGYGQQAFLDAYAANKRQQNEEAVSNNAVASAIKTLMANQREWTGTSTVLLQELDKIAGEERIDIKAKGWPKAANSLSRKLNELKTTLEAAGIKIIRDRQDKRIIYIRSHDPEAADNIVKTVETVETLTESAFAGRRYIDDIPSMQNNTVDNTGGEEPRENRPSDDIDDIDDIFPHSKEDNKKEKNENPEKEDDQLMEVEI